MNIVPPGLAVLAAWFFVPGLDAGAKAQGMSTVHISAAGGVMVQQDGGTSVSTSPTQVIFGFAPSSDGSVLITMPGFLSAPQRNGASIRLDGGPAEQLRTGTTSAYETLSVSAGRVSTTSAFSTLNNPLTLIIAQYN